MAKHPQEGGCLRVSACASVCICMRMFVWLHVCVRAHACACVCVSACAWVSAWPCLSACVQTVCVCVLTCMRVCVLMCVCVRRLLGVAGLRGAVALELLHQEFAAASQHVTQLPQGAAALEGPWAVLGDDTHALKPLCPDPDPPDLDPRHLPSSAGAAESGRSWPQCNAGVIRFFMYKIYIFIFFWGEVSLTIFLFYTYNTFTYFFRHTYNFYLL